MPTGAGVTLIGPGLSPRYVAAFDANAPRFEQVQSDLSQGPCCTAFRTGSAVVVADLTDDDRYPQSGPAAMFDPSGAERGGGDRGDRRR